MTTCPDVIIIGLDGRAFDLIRSLVDACELPNIARLLHPVASGKPVTKNKAGRPNMTEEKRGIKKQLEGPGSL